MTALAILGSATSTSFTSRGRSTTTDLPTPSERKRVLTEPRAEVVTESFPESLDNSLASSLSTSAAKTLGNGLSVSVAMAENNTAPTATVRIAD